MYQLQCIENVWRNEKHQYCAVSRHSFASAYVLDVFQKIRTACSSYTHTYAYADVAYCQHNYVQMLGGRTPWCSTWNPGAHWLVICIFHMYLERNSVRIYLLTSKFLTRNLYEDCVFLADGYFPTAWLTDVLENIWFSQHNVFIHTHSSSCNHHASSSCVEPPSCEHHVPVLTSDIVVLWFGFQVSWERVKCGCGKWVKKHRLSDPDCYCSCTHICTHVWWLEDDIAVARGEQELAQMNYYRETPPPSICVQALETHWRTLALSKLHERNLGIKCCLLGSRKVPFI